MDQRLLDNTVKFMNRLNLQNRYDHLIFAGAAMGVRRLESPTGENGSALPWKSVFFHHLIAAIDVLRREIKDIFLLEHMDCGAYKQLHPVKKVREKYNSTEDAAELRKDSPQRGPPAGQANQDLLRSAVHGRRKPRRLERHPGPQFPHGSGGARQGTVGRASVHR
jgi:hypothetical protein